MEHEKYMKEALKEAMQAAAEDEVPIGAVIVSGGRIIAKGRNMTERLNDPTAHAEMIAITAATDCTEVVLGEKEEGEQTRHTTEPPFQ